MSDADRPLLGAYAAKQCPYRLFREHDPTEPAVPAPPDDALQQLFDDGIAFEDDVVEELLATHGADAVAIPGRDEAEPDTRRALTGEALNARIPVILGALMEHDLDGRRLGEIDILVATGQTTAAGRAEYRAIDVKSHRCTLNLDDPDGVAEPVGSVHDLQLTGEPIAVPGLEPKYREDDCLQLAHYHRLLQTHGHAEPDESGRHVWGGILGMERVVAWFDLERPAFSTLTPQETPGADPSISFHRRSHSKKRTALDRYDFEFDFRLRIADTALLRTNRDEPPMVAPVSVAECARCPWYEPCHDELEAVDDVSLVKPVGYPEWRVHRFVGNATVQQLSELDLATAEVMTRLSPARLTAAREWAEQAAPSARLDQTDWPQLAEAGLVTAADMLQLHTATLAYAATPISAKSLVEQIHAARSAVAGELVVTPGWDDAEIPRGDVEIDLDLENVEYVYLWGARLTEVPEDWPEVRGSYVSFASFDPLPADDPDGERIEAQLVARLWSWLDEIRARAHDEGRSVRIYGYASAGVEARQLKRIAGAGAIDELPSVDDVEALIDSEDWVDLYPLMKHKYWSNWGHGLKVTATASGFAWRDDDPGGFVSMGWFRDAIDGVDRDANIARILAYNEDDCRATAALR